MSNWRLLLRNLHRDAGYLGLGLTVVYAVSGLAVNHRDDWNYDQSTQRQVTYVGAPAELLASLPAERREAITASLDAMTIGEQALLVAAIGSTLGRTRAPRNAFWRGADRLSLFFEAGERDTIDYQPSTGLCTHTVMRDRPILRDFNFLHLNRARRAWTYVADAFAVVLAFLGISGVLMVKGKRSVLSWRGGLLATTGIAIPTLALLLTRCG